MLSDDPAKPQTYEDDVYYREAMVHIGALGSDQLRHMLSRTSFALFKPEAIVGRRFEDAFDYLHRRGFRPLGALPVSFDRHTLRGMWWYQLNSAPLAVLRVVDMTIREADHLFVPLVDMTADPRSGSAARRLSDCKGSKRDTGSGHDVLREALRCQTQCLNFVHVPDEPADLVRELGVLFDFHRLPAALAMLTGDAVPAGLAERVTEAYQSHPWHPLDLERSVALLRRAAAAADHEAPVRALLRALRAPATEHDPLRLIEWLDGADLELPRWDRIVVAAHLASAERAHKEPLIGPPPGQRAQARLAEISAARRGRREQAMEGGSVSAPARRT